MYYTVIWFNTIARIDQTIQSVHVSEFHAISDELSNIASFTANTKHDKQDFCQLMYISCTCETHYLHQYEMSDCTVEKFDFHSLVLDKLHIPQECQTMHC